jgi:hypothetical protein
MAQTYQTGDRWGNPEVGATQPTAAIDPQTRRPLALFTDFATTPPLVSVRAPTVP